MAVKIRLKRMGKIRAPFYRVVVADSRTKRDGRVIEEIGIYHPTENPSVIKIDSDRAQYWLGVGAQPTDQVKALLKLTGDWGTFTGEGPTENRVQVAGEKEAFAVDTNKKSVVKPKAEKKEEASTETGLDEIPTEEVEGSADAPQADAAVDAEKEDIVAEADAQAEVAAEAVDAEITEEA